MAAAFAPRLRWLVALLAVAALAALATHRGSPWNHELSSLNPIPQADRQLDAELRAALGASDARHVVAVRAATPEAALLAAEQVAGHLDPLIPSGKLGGYECPSRILPSPALQRARLASLPDAETLRARLRAALEGLPLRADRLEPFIDATQAARSGGLLTRETIAGTALEQALEGLLFRDSEGRWTAILGIRPTAGGSSGRADIEAVRAAVAASGVQDAMVVDLKHEIDRLYAGYFNRALAMSAVGFAVIVALLFLALRSPRRVLRVMAPILTGVLVVAAWQIWTGNRLTLLHLVGLLLVVAVGSNYALFFDRLSQGADAFAARTLASLGLANATTVAGFGVLSLSSVPVLESIGSTVALGAFLTLVFSAIMMGPRKAVVPA